MGEIKLLIWLQAIALSDIDMAAHNYPVTAAMATKKVLKFTFDLSRKHIAFLAQQCPAASAGSGISSSKKSLNFLLLIGWSGNL